MECFLRIAGRDFDVGSALKCCGLTPDGVWKRGDIKSRNRGRRHENSGLRFDVSDNTDGRIPQQVEQAIHFVREHEDELRMLASRHDVEQAYLDFGWDFEYERSPYSWNFIPIDLLQFCVRIGLSICFSVGAAASTDIDSAQIAEKGQLPKDVD